MASNSHGNSNEIEIANYLNGKKYKDLNLTMKEFIKYICLSKHITYCDETVILSNYVTNNKKKEDIYITIENIKMGISLKMGSGNSCHQEKIEDFVSYITNKMSATERICNLWRHFIWADGTLDGNGPTAKGPDGKIPNRCGTTKYKKKYPAERQELQKFLNDNLPALIEHSVFVGEHNSDVDFIYHGTYKQGRWISKDEIIEFQKSQSNTNGRACLYLGNLTVQMWNPSENGNNEKKRGQIQFKYGQMENDFNLIMKDTADTVGTFMGDLEEFDLSKTLNKNKSNPMWRTLLPHISDFTDYYVVKVSSHQYSTLSKQKVKTKSDAYVIKATIDRNFLLTKEYVLEESDVKNIPCTILKDTGISIKLKNSKNFTYQKLTKKSFCKAFSDIENVNFWLLSLLIYSKDSERHKNEKIITDLGFTQSSYLSKVNSIMGISIDNTNNSAFWDAVRKKAQEKIKNEINQNKILYEKIFVGKHWFEAPYHANFLYESGKLKKNKVTDFSITTGSGRSKGKYSIEVTPSKS